MTTATKKPTRRGKRKNHHCARETCPKAVRRSYRYCSPVCSGVDRELTKLTNVGKTLGSDLPAVSEAWASLVGVGDAWTAYLNANHQLINKVLDAGWTIQQWNDLRDGKVTP